MPTTVMHAATGSHASPSFCAGVGAGLVHSRRYAGAGDVGRVPAHVAGTIITTTTSHDRFRPPPSTHESQHHDISPVPVVQLAEEMGVQRLIIDYADYDIAMSPDEGDDPVDMTRVPVSPSLFNMSLPWVVQGLTDPSMVITSWCLFQGRPCGWTTCSRSFRRCSIRSRSA